MMNRGTGSPAPGSGIGPVSQVVKDGLCDGTKVIMRVTPLHLIDHADWFSVRRGSLADAFDQFEPQVRQVTKAEVHPHGISMWMQTLK